MLKALRDAIAILTPTEQFVLAALLVVDSMLWLVVGVLLAILWRTR